MDVMTGKMLKNLPQEMLSYIAKLCNKIIETGQFPKNLKIAQIIKKVKVKNWTVTCDSLSSGKHVAVSVSVLVVV